MRRHSSDKPPAKPRSRRTLTPEEKHAWREANRATEKLFVEEDTPPAIPPVVAPPSVTPAPPLPPLRDKAKAVPELPAKSLGDYSGMDKRTANRVRRGQLAIEARLDLHGTSRGEAHTRLTSFILRTAREGKRLVLVITGKGARSGGRSILKDEVPRWLKEKPLSGRILAIDYAQAKDGGSGALYVYLRKER